MKYHLGCGSNYRIGYVNVDFPQDKHTVMDVKADAYANLLTFQMEPSTEIMSHHVFEHFNYPESLHLLVKWADSLTIDGELVIGLPDVEVLCRELASSIAAKNVSRTIKVIRLLYGSHEADWAYHINGWSEETLTHVLETLGFSLLRSERSGNPGSEFPNCTLTVRFKKILNIQDCRIKARDTLKLYVNLPAEGKLLKEMENQYDALN